MYVIHFAYRVFFVKICMLKISTNAIIAVLKACMHYILLHNINAKLRHTQYNKWFGVHEYKSLSTHAQSLKWNAMITINLKQHMFTCSTMEFEKFTLVCFLDCSNSVRHACYQFKFCILVVLVWIIAVLNACMQERIRFFCTISMQKVT